MDSTKPQREPRTQLRIHNITRSCNPTTLRRKREKLMKDKAEVFLLKRYSKEGVESSDCRSQNQFPISLKCTKLLETTKYNTTCMNTREQIGHLFPKGGNSSGE